MSQRSFPSGFWGAPVREAAEIPWIWRGMLAPGKLTLLTALWKSGKTTLLAHLLSRRRAGGEFLGLPVRAGISAVVSEEDEDLWTMRLRNLDLGKTCLFCRPFLGRPTLVQLQELSSHLVEMKKEHGLDLAIFDTLVTFLPTRDENNAGLVLDALEPFAALLREGLSVWLLHHPKKGDPELGQAARGSGALLGRVDISLEMRHPGGDPFTRRRRLLSWSRFRETPRQMIIEITPDHSDYVRLPDAGDDFHTHWETLRLVLQAAEEPLTRAAILRAWPPGVAKPSDTSLWKWLTDAVELGLACRGAKGTKTDPHRYWLAGAEAGAGEGEAA